jgi:chromosomal replication initiation ATPase DnaA
MRMTMAVAEHCGGGNAGQQDTKLKGALMRRAIEASVAAVFDVEAEALRIATRGPARAAFARQVAMYLTHVVCGLTLTEVGRLFGRDRTTVAYACGVVEDQRDEAEFDARLTHLEQSVGALVAALPQCRGWL